MKNLKVVAFSGGGGGLRNEKVIAFLSPFWGLCGLWAVLVVFELWMSSLMFSSAAVTTSTTNRECYVRAKEYRGESFFSPNNFEFFTANDPTQGFVNYVDKATAERKGYISVKDGRAIIRPDSTFVVPPYARGRDSVRIHSKEAFNDSLWVLNLNHMPTGCGTWPAFWSFGEGAWPLEGEIDIIETVNLQDKDSTALHTMEGCVMHKDDERKFSGKWKRKPDGGYYTDCYYLSTSFNAGCSVAATEEGSAGTAFNEIGGGYYVLEMNREEFIRVWFFSHKDAPWDLKSGHPNPDSWSKLPMAYYTLKSNCPGAKFFKNQHIIINLTFCGVWAGNTFEHHHCPENGHKQSCVDFVRSNPAYFKNAYWDINYLRVYKKMTRPECSVSHGIKPLIGCNNFNSNNNINLYSNNINSNVFPKMNLSPLVQHICSRS